MLISKSHRFIFYHTYKVAGSSIRRALIPYCSKTQVALQALDYVTSKISHRLRLPPLYQYHPNLELALQQFGDSFESYFKFAFVRDPLDWQKSLYFFSIKNKRHHQHNLIKRMSFEEYIAWRIGHDIKTQFSLLSDAQGKLLVDKVYKLENLQPAVTDLRSRLGIDIIVPHINKSPRHGNCQLTPETLHRFVEAFKKDYMVFGYEIPKP